GDGGGGRAGGPAFGGALGLRGTAIFTLSHSTLSGNQATGGNGGRGGHGGGGGGGGRPPLCFFGPPPPPAGRPNPAPADTAVGGPGGAGGAGGTALGGVIQNTVGPANSTNTLTLSYSTLLDNQALGGAGGAGGGTGGVATGGVLNNFSPTGVETAAVFLYCS